MDEQPNLEENKTDLALAGGKALVGSLPYVGPIVAEIVGSLIPNQRIDRITEFLKILDKKVQDLDANVREQKMKSEEFIDLLEDGMWQAARALTRKRKEQIASVLTNSLYHGEINHIRDKKLLSLLNELNDPQLIILKSYDPPHAPLSSSFYERHRDILEGHLRQYGATDNEEERISLYKAFRNDLERLGLLEFHYEPTIETTGELASETFGLSRGDKPRLTALGRLLLQYIET